MTPRTATSPPISRSMSSTPSAIRYDGLLQLPIFYSFFRRARYGVSSWTSLIRCAPCSCRQTSIHSSSTSRGPTSPHSSSSANHNVHLHTPGLLLEVTAEPTMVAMLTCHHAGLPSLNLPLTRGVQRLRSRARGYNGLLLRESDPDLAT